MAIPTDKWLRVDELFRLAAARPVNERNQFLAEACAGDPEVRREVESLLKFDGANGDFMELPAVVLVPDAFTDHAGNNLSGRRIGRYRIQREVGRGGMGAVYEAWRDDEEFRQRVAIKLVKRGLGTDDILRRFRQERQILAALEHPNIARLLDGGTTDDGLPYLAMEFVEGLPVTQYCDQNKLSIDERLKLFLVVCSAVSYAHQHLVIHRDLKPGNVLVTSEGAPKLLDFGIAKLLGTESEARDGHTVTQFGVMTPEYASPQQVRGEQVTTATDVYSLGVLLYELLTGQRPYRLTSRSPDEVARVICEQEPTRPSRAIRDRETRRWGSGETQKPSSQVASSPCPRVSASGLKGDLDNIILRALRKEPERRYASVEQFAEDIRRHLDGLPVSARPDTFAYRSAKFVRRHRAGVTVVALVLIGLVIALATVAWQARVAARERDVARREKAKAERVNAFLQNILGFSDPSWLSTNRRGAGETTMADALAEAARRAETELADEPEVQAAVRFTIGYTYRVQSRFDAAEPHLKAALDLRRRVLGPVHQDTAQSMIGLAELLMLKGNYAEAEPLFRDALDVYRRAQAAGEVDQRWFFIALGDYGLWQWFQGDLAAADSLMREALATSSGFSGADRAAVAILYGNLGLVRRDRGDLEGAIELFQKSIEEHRAVSREPRFELAISLGNLGSLLALKGETAQAEPFLRETLKIYLDTVGKTHQYTAYAFIHLADMRDRRGEYPRAKEEIDRALEIQRRALPEGHIDFARSWVVLGRILTHAGQAARADVYLRQALQQRTRALPPGHWMIAEAQVALGECLTERRRYGEAEELLKASYATYESRFGREDPRTVAARQRLLKLYEAWGKPDLIPR